MIIFENNTTGTVTGGGNDAPSSGSGETWTVSTTTFPSSLGSGVYYHVADPALPSEKIKVIAISGSGPYTWTTVRGDEGTTPLSHASNFTVQQVVTADDFLYQPGSLIAYMSYGPATQVTYNVTTSLTIMDGTNLTFSFNPPPSGNVIIDVSADWAFASVDLTQATDMFMGLVLHGNTSVVYGALQSWCGNDNSLVIGAHDLHRYHVTGLTNGTSVQMDLAMGLSNTLGSGGFANFYATAAGQGLTIDPTGPITVDVFASY